MRSVCLVFACLLLLSAPLSAQGGPRRGPWFPEEDFRSWIQIQQKLGACFEMKDYKAGLEALGSELELLLGVKEKIESGETKLEHPQATEEQLRQMGLSDLNDKLASCWYNRACCLSMTGEKAPAIEALKKSIALGFVDKDHIRQDTDLDGIREEPGFKDALGLIDYNDILEIHVPEGLGEAPVPLLVVLHSAKSNEANIIRGFSELAGEMKMILAAPRAPITVGPRQYEWKSYSSGKDPGLRKVAETIAAVREKHTIGKVFVIGARQGGEIATLFAIRNATKVAGALQLNSYWNRFDYADADALTAASAAGVKIALVHGREDPFFGKAEESVEAFKQAEIEARLMPFDGGKQFPEKEVFFGLVKEALAWLTG